MSHCLRLNSSILPEHYLTIVLRAGIIVLFQSLMEILERFYHDTGSYVKKKSLKLCSISVLSYLTAIIFIN